MQNFITFISALLLSTVGHMATDIYLPSFPAIVSDFETSTANVQLTLGAYMLSFCLVPLFAGPLSDRMGRKRPILFGIGIGIFSTILCALSSNIYYLIFARFLQGVGLGIIVAVSRAILPDNFQGKELAKYFSYNTIALPLLLAIAPPLGGIIQEHSSWRMVFVFIVSYLLVLIFLVKVLIPKQVFKPTTQRYEDYITSFKNLLKNKQFMLYSIYSVLIFVGVTSYLTLGSFIFEEIAGLSPSQIGFMSLFCCMVAMSSGFVNSRLINLYSARSLLYFAIPFIFLSGGLCIFLSYYAITEASLLLFPIVIFFSMVPLSFANSGSLGIETVKGNFGAAMALLSSLQFLGGGLVSALISLLGGEPVTTLGTVFLCVAIGCLMINIISSRQLVEKYS